MRVCCGPEIYSSYKHVGNTPKELILAFLHLSVFALPQKLNEKAVPQTFNVTISDRTTIRRTALAMGILLPIIILIKLFQTKITLHPNARSPKVAVWKDSRMFALWLEKLTASKLSLRIADHFEKSLHGDFEQYALRRSHGLAIIPW